MLCWRACFSRFCGRFDSAVSAGASATAADCALSNAGAVSSCAPTSAGVSSAGLCSWSKTIVGMYGWGLGCVRARMDLGVSGKGPKSDVQPVLLECWRLDVHCNLPLVGVHVHCLVRLHLLLNCVALMRVYVSGVRRLQRCAPGCWECRHLVNQVLPMAALQP